MRATRCAPSSSPSLAKLRGTCSPSAGLGRTVVARHRARILTVSDGQESEGALLTARDVADLFRRSSRTLWNWERVGLLIPVRIRKRRFYSRLDIEKLTLGTDPGRSDLSQ